MAEIHREAAAKYFDCSELFISIASALIRLARIQETPFYYVYTAR